MPELGLKPTHKTIQYYCIARDLFQKSSIRGACLCFSKDTAHPHSGLPLPRSGTRWKDAPKALCDHCG